MNILIINEGASLNFGDQAIRYTLEKYLNELGHTTTFIDFTRLTNQQFTNKNKISYFKAIFPKKLKFLLRIKWLINNYFKIKKVLNSYAYDRIIIGGGQLILGNSNFPYALFLWVFLNKKIKNKKLIIFGVGVENKFNFLEKKIFNISLKQTSSIYVRDNNSIKNLDFNFNMKSYFVHDLAFSISKFIKIEKQETEPIDVLLVYPPDFITVAKRYTNMSYDKYQLEWKYKIENISTENTVIKISYSDMDSDREYSLKLFNYLKNIFNNKIYFVENHSMNTMIKEINSSSHILSGRMHPLILGLSYKKKITTFEVSKKLIDFKHSYNDTSIDIDLIYKQTKIILNKELSL